VSSSTVRRRSSRSTTASGSKIPPRCSPPERSGVPRARGPSIRARRFFLAAPRFAACGGSDEWR
jgi:hypothetical protein